MAQKSGKLTLTSFRPHVNHWKFALGRPQAWIWNGFRMAASLFLSPHWKLSIGSINLRGDTSETWESIQRSEVRYLSGPRVISDPGAYLRPSSTVEVICFHGTPPIYQQGRAIKVAITHIGALPPPEMHRFDARCASRCRHGQSLMRCELDRGGWIGKPGETKRAMSAQVLLCRFALSQTPASRCNPSRRLVILRVHRSAVSIFSIIRCYVMVCDSCYKNNWGFVENHLLTLNWVCLTECWGTDQS